MSVETQVALIGAVSTILLALIPFAVQALKLRGLRITEQQEYIIHDFVTQGARLAEEYARDTKRPSLTGPEKLEVATRYAQKLLQTRGVKLAYDEVAQRVEAHLTSALENRRSSLSIPEHLK